MHTGTLRLLATGNAGGSDPALMLASRSFRETLDVLEPLADYVVLAAADIDATADAQLTARQAHGIVVAVTDPGTRPRQLDQVFARLETGRAPVLGAVLVEAGRPDLDQAVISRRLSAPQTVPVAIAGAGAVLAAAALTWHSPSQLTLAAVACLAVCVALTAIERARCDDWLNGATFLLVPVALGFGLRGAVTDRGATAI